MNSTKNVLKKESIIIELAGTAGAGKSTLIKAMMQRNENIKNFPIPAKISYLPTLYKLISQWLPLYLKEYRNSRWFSSLEIRNILYLDTWIPYIRNKSRTKKEIFIIDPGSVYWLSSLLEAGPPITKHPRFQSWWKEKFEQWSSGLDVIIWLDVDEELCLQRVHARDEWHEIKDISIQSGLAELKYFRNSYAKIIPEMELHHPVKVFYFRTDQLTTQEIVDKIFSENNPWDF